MQFLVLSTFFGIWHLRSALVVQCFSTVCCGWMNMLLMFSWFSLHFLSKEKGVCKCCVHVCIFRTTCVASPKGWIRRATRQKTYVKLKRQSEAQEGCARCQGRRHRRTWLDIDVESRPQTQEAEEESKTLRAPSYAKDSAIFVFVAIETHTYISQWKITKGDVATCIDLHVGCKNPAPWVKNRK